MAEKELEPLIPSRLPLLSPSADTGCSALNLDYFGPEEESRSSSRSSISPPPGVDHELYELTISKLETSSSSSHLEDALNRLMSTTEKTSVSLRKAVQDEQLSEEAGRVIAGLPNMSFMQAKVLMFPSILIPEDDV
ncbi:aftiphilin-like [Amphiprion ocellaris]|uniref:aftiphilin-like n=1 Tax=Amphiprion ocellaris TaxID=80972 RepID=UPI002410F0D7|nr:aftiphilin-like [Amphiprion ocellaris]